MATITCAKVRKWALALSGAEEHDHRGRPSFRVRGRIFATLWPDEKRAVLKLPLAHQAALVASRPKAWSLTPWARQGWTSAHLPHADEAELREHVELAWRELAPKRVVAALDGGPPRDRGRRRDR